RKRQSQFESVASEYASSVDTTAAALARDHGARPAVDHRRGRNATGCPYAVTTVADREQSGAEIYFSSVVIWCPDRQSAVDDGALIRMMLDAKPNEHAKQDALERT